MREKIIRWTIFHLASLDFYYNLGLETVITIIIILNFLRDF
jgi:hypothetical protein